MAIKISHDFLDPNSSISPCLMFLNKDFKRGDFFFFGIIQKRRLETRYGHTVQLITASNSNRYLPQYDNHQKE
jgi:hypothetical protein